MVGCQCPVFLLSLINRSGEQNSGSWKVNGVVVSYLKNGCSSEANRAVYMSLRGISSTMHNHFLIPE